MEEVLKNIKEMYEDFALEKNVLKKYNYCFGMAVFGTLRSIPNDWHNSYLMKGYCHHSKAFLPHVSPKGLWLDFHKDSSGVFEVYFYDRESWDKMIRGVDSLEGFRPNNNKYKDGYQRTLMNIKLLPDDFQSGFYECRAREPAVRDFKIPKDTWDGYISIPAWTYSNTTVNRQCALLDDNPVLWAE